MGSRALTLSINELGGEREQQVQISVVRKSRILARCRKKVSVTRAMRSGQSKVRWEGRDPIGHVLLSGFVSKQWRRP